MSSLQQVMMQRDFTNGAGNLLQDLRTQQPILGS